MLYLIERFTLMNSLFQKIFNFFLNKSRIHSFLLIIFLKVTSKKRESLIFYDYLWPEWLTLENWNQGITTPLYPKCFFIIFVNFITLNTVIHLFIYWRCSESVQTVQYFSINKKINKKYSYLLIILLIWKILRINGKVIIFIEKFPLWGKSEEFMFLWKQKSKKINIPPPPSFTNVG